MRGKSLLMFLSLDIFNNWSRCLENIVGRQSELKGLKRYMHRLQRENGISLWRRTFSPPIARYIVISRRYG